MRIYRQMGKIVIIIVHNIYLLLINNTAIHGAHIVYLIIDICFHKLYNRKKLLKYWIFVCSFTDSICFPIFLSEKETK